MIPITGNNVLVIVNDLPIFCGISATFNEEKSSVESTPTVSALGRLTYNKLIKRSWSVNVTGLTKVANTDGQEDFFTIISPTFFTSAQTITISFDDGEGNNISITGVMFCQKASISGPATQFAPGSVDFIGTGEYVLSTDGSGSSGGSGGCVPVGGGTFDPPDSTWGATYAYTFALTGTAPFAITGQTKPSWMSRAIVGSNLVLSGTPDTVGTGITVSFDIINACGADTFSATIDIADGGRPVFVINNTAHDIVLQNANGIQHTFLASNGSDNNMFMQDANMIVVSIAGGGSVNFEFLQSLPSTTINSGTVSGGGTATTSDFANTNYLRFT